MLQYKSPNKSRACETKQKSVRENPLVEIVANYVLLINWDVSTTRLLQKKRVSHLVNFEEQSLLRFLSQKWLIFDGCMENASLFRH